MKGKGGRFKKREDVKGGRYRKLLRRVYQPQLYCLPVGLTIEAIVVGASRRGPRQEKKKKCSNLNFEL